MTLDMGNDTWTWNRRPGHSPEWCIQCGQRPPAKPRRICTPCRNANEKQARTDRIDHAAKLPCAEPGCPEPRAVTPTQVKIRCVEHHRLYRAALRRSKGVPERKVRPVAPEGEWWCSRCEQIKPIEDCVRKGDKWGRCKSCEKEIFAERIARDPEKVRRATRDSARRNRRRQLYGVTNEELAAQTVVQDGKCVCCLKERSLVPDHDHQHDQPKTRDAVRGLICSQCNSALGLLQDDPVVIERLLEYIKNPPFPFR